MDGFEPKTAFEGYVKAKLEGIECEIGQLRDRHILLSDRVRNIEIKGGIWGAISGAVSGTLAYLGFKQW